METMHENEPLLYIEQPTMRKPERKMQRHFHSNGKQVHSNGKQEKKNSRRFNQLNLEEKILYITQVPPQLPALKCDVKTEHNAYRGMIKQATNDELIIRLQNRRIVTIKKNSVIDIQLISF